MDAERFDRLCALFEEAQELEPGARGAFLDEACAGDGELRAEVERMLAAGDEAPDFLERPAELDDLDELDPTTTVTTPTGVAGDTARSIGPYRTVRVLGSGGMGIVYEALQENPARRVALKVMRSGFDSSSFARRFRYEVEVLARLQHPGIAQIHEAGVHTGPAGAEVPFFAMEYVAEADDLLTWASRTKAPLERRLEVFLAVCEAVQHGHQQGVVHRDLKPANVLVDTSGRPKVIDFGVARAVGETDARTQATRSGEIVGTLTRMSPEQLVGDPALVDTRADVYALGLLLYELLCGRLPYDLDGLSWTDVARVIRDAPPRDPSRVDRSVPRDLGWVVLRALEKEPERRYPAVSELAADLRRFLRTEPVLAGPPSGVYRARKFLRRHVIAVSAAAAVVVALLVGATAAGIGLVRARDAEAAAKADAARTRTLWSLTSDIVRSINPQAGGVDVRMVDVLRASSSGVELPDGEPGIEGNYLALLGEGFTGLGFHEEAYGHLARALELLREDGGADSPRALMCARIVIGTLCSLGRTEEARELYEETLARCLRVHGPDHEETLHLRAVEALSLRTPGSAGRLELLEELGTQLGEWHGKADSVVVNLALEVAMELEKGGRFDEALAHVDGTIAALGARYPADDLRVVFARRDRALFLRDRGDLLGAETELQELAPVWLERFGQGSDQATTLMVELAKVKKFLGRHEEAEIIVRRELDARLPRTGDADEFTAQLLVERADLGYQRGAYEEAEAWFRRAIAALTTVHGEGDIRTLSARFGLARMLLFGPRRAEGVDLLWEIVETTERVHGEDSRYLVEFLAVLANGIAEEEPETALALTERCAAIARATLPPQNWSRTVAVMSLGLSLVDAGRLDEAEAVFLEALDLIPDVRARDGTRKMARRHLVQIYEYRGDTESADRYRDPTGG